MNQIDHLVIAAQTLPQGVDYVREALDIDIPKGGFHQTMGTHNHLMQLGNESYLEVIAIDPNGKVPTHPRWFGLDDGLMRESLKKSPRLVTWMINTADLAATRQIASFDIGKINELHRDQLRWQIALTDDGRLLANGLLPHVIQWLSQPHPSHGMSDLNCRLESIEIYHNRADWYRTQLSSIGADHLVTVQDLDDQHSPYLSARIETPSGIKIINSQP